MRCDGLENKYLYEIEEGAVTITGYMGDSECLCIPEQLDGLPVRIIGKEAFADNEGSLVSVTVPSSVREIRDGAFKFCLGLQNLILSEGLEVLGTDILLVTPVSELYIPATVHTIENPHELGGIRIRIAPESPYYYSDGYGLYAKRADGDVLLAVDLQSDRSSYYIHSGTRIIGQGAFCGQESLTEIWCPDSLRVIEAEAFESCRKLQQIHFNQGLEEIGDNACSYCSLMGMLELPETVARIGQRVFTNTFDWDHYQDCLEGIRILGDSPYFCSDTSGFYQKLSDGSWKLLRYFDQGTRFRIPDQVSVIGSHAFRRAKVKEVILPASVKLFETKVFFENQKIETIVLETEQIPIYIPRTPIYRRDEITELFRSGTGAERFDFASYDALWSTYLYIQDQAGMACFRLQYPNELSAEMAHTYRSWLQEQFVAVMEDIAGRKDRQLLAALTQIEFFDGNNIDDAIDILNRQKQTELLGYLMDYKQAHFETEEFDFSL